MNLTHRYVQDRLLSGQRLSSNEQAALAAHLAACPECRAFADFHRQLSESLPAAYPPTLTSSRDREVRARIEAVKARLPRRRWTAYLWRGSLSLAGAAAALLLIVSILIAFPRMMPGQPGAAPDAPDETGLVFKATVAAAVVPTATRAATQSAGTPAGGQIERLPSPDGRRTAASPQEPGQLPPAPDSFVPGVAVNGDTAYIGVGLRLAAVDISRPAEPRVIALSQELAGRVGKILPLDSEQAPRVVASAGRYLVVIEGPNPRDLGLVTQSKLPGPIAAMILDVSADRLYTAGALNGDASKGFITIHAINPTGPLDLLDTLQLDAPVRGLALWKATLYAALAGDTPGVAAIPLQNDRFGALDMAITGRLVDSMTITHATLYTGGDGDMRAYYLPESGQPWLSWKTTRAADGSTIPGHVRGFILREGAIHISGVAENGRPFLLTVAPPEPVRTGSVVDTASCTSAGLGRLLVAGDRLEIYDIHDPDNLLLLGAIKVQP